MLEILVYHLVKHSLKPIGQADLIRHIRVWEQLK